jgi:hypothetical protein
MHRFLLAGALLLSFAASVAAQEPPKVTPLLSRDLTDIPGKEGTMLIVEYAPGGADPVHRHNAHAFVYVLEAQTRHAQCANERPLLAAKRTLTNRCLPISIYEYTA